MPCQAQQKRTAMAAGLFMSSATFWEVVGDCPAAPLDGVAGLEAVGGLGAPKGRMGFAGYFT